MQVGDIVRLNREIMGEPADTRAYVYEVYMIGDKPGVSLITENGEDLGGFNEDEQAMYIRHPRPSGLNYNFTSVIRLAEDFRNGYFDSAFGEDKLKKVKEKLVVKECTKGHGKSCFYAKSDNCTCNCGGDNHGRAYKS